MEEVEKLNSLDHDLYFELLELVKGEFKVEDAYLWNNIPTFTITPTHQLEEKIDGLISKLKPKGMQILIRRKGGKLLLQVIPLRKEAASRRKFLSINYPLILFLVTVVTVTITGYINAENFVYIMKILGRDLHIDKELYVLESTAAYTVSLMGVLGLHELGHTIACRRHRIKATLPIFIPGIPLFTPGTFGALIRQKSPTLNRNQLFDIGFSGPFIGFITAIIVSLIGYSMSVPISMAEYQLITNQLGGGQYFLLPLLFQGLRAYAFPKPNSFTHILHPVGLSGWMATLLTFLNIFPIGQLDGGHVSRALFGAKWHRRISYMMIFVMILAGWWSMALLILVFLRSYHPGVIDEATGISTGRKVLSILVIVIFISSFTLSPDSPLLYLIYA